MKENEIRPEILVKRYIELSAHDAEMCFDNDERTDVDCVACGEKKVSHQFIKNGFAYTECDKCMTLFLSPRPTLSAFENFYRDSESSRYWAEVFFPAVAEIRRDKIFLPRVEGLGRICEEAGIAVENLIDVGAGYGIFLDEWRKKFPKTQLLAIEPSKALAAECFSKGLEVVEDIVENVTGHVESADLVTCFEVLEHVYDPLSFVNDLRTLVKPGGYLFVSTLSIDGFDLQVLREKSSQISPPHHINFLSVQGFKDLFERAELVDVTITTPGKLDVDIVRNASNKDPSLLKGQRFLSNLIEDDIKAPAFQNFLSENNLSSHVWVLARKPI